MNLIYLEIPQHMEPAMAKANPITKITKFLMPVTSLNKNTPHKFATIDGPKELNKIKFLVKLKKFL